MSDSRSSNNVPDQTRRRRRSAAPRWYGWVPAVIGLPALFAVGMLPVRDSIQDELTSKARTVLDDADLGEVDVEFVGRDATISGPLDPGDPDIARAHDLVRNGTGVRHVTDDFAAGSAPLSDTTDPTVLDAASTPDPNTLRLSQDGDVLTLSGTAFDEATAAALRQSIVNQFPDATLEDQLTVKEADGTPLGEAGAQAFATMAGAAFNSGSGVEDLAVSFADGAYSLTGVANDATAATTAFDAAAQAATGAGTTVVNDITVTTPADTTNVGPVDGAAMPDGWNVNVDTASTPPILEGAVPSEDASQTIESAVSTALGTEVDNRIEVDPGLSAADPDTVAGVAEAISAPLEIVAQDGGTVILSGVVGEVTLEGRVSTDDARSAAEEAAGALAGEGGSVLNELNVSEAASAADVAEANANLDDVLQNVEFEVGSAALTPAGTETVKAVAQVLDENPTVNIRVEGHTDNTGSAETNTQLSDDRAQSVVDLLVAEGVDPSRLTARGFGDTRPIESNDTEEGRAANRRIEFVVS
jgi:outer membrane protein OmpA-like peptidoglycan-associated protein